jgi:serine/threonine protein phosphatase 1
VGAEPKVFNERAFGIDTGACHGQSLTALVLPTFSLVSVPARDNHWKITQKRWQLPVLASRPWSTMSFEQIQKKAGELGGRHPDAVAWLQGVQAWAEALQKQLPVLAEAVEAEAQALKEKAGERFHQEASQHPAGTILIRWAAGRLSRDHLGCASPADVFALADSLGIALSL